MIPIIEIITKIIIILKQKQTKIEI